MLYHSAKRKASVQMTRADPLNPESYPFNSDQEWKSFKEALTKIGYFGVSIQYPPPAFQAC